MAHEGIVGVRCHRPARTAQLNALMSAHPGLGARLQQRRGRRLTQLPEQLTLLATEEDNDLLDQLWQDPESITRLW